MSNTHNNLGDKVKLALSHAEIKQYAVARALGVDRSQVSRYVNGQCELKASQVKAIADLTGKPVSYFYEPSN